ncbi:T-cell surface glycoprotein CD3 delta chain-like isoform X3 [Acipenser ruthenus]|uniref:T-cell surface glycoprotein CD3 delta chain-like isoform X3 n=1 Tax=Acipenser ruthenus TaxID=7906 RepID=UPI00145A576B|nr:T-cell surface glycoprotein CD3 delta chain-like isoform X3 [Acipenser ruthenus]
MAVGWVFITSLITALLLVELVNIQNAAAAETACNNCIKLEAGTVAGIVVGDVIATVLIAVAVYCVSSQQKSGAYISNKASDRQNLLMNDGNNMVYEPLRERDDGAYSKLAPRGQRS